jgi:hypothetical protein
MSELTYSIFPYPAGIKHHKRTHLLFHHLGEIVELKVLAVLHQIIPADVIPANMSRADEIRGFDRSRIAHG